MSKTKATKQMSREFGLTVGIAFLVLGGILFWLGKAAYPYLLGFGAAFLLAGIAVPVALNPVQKVWMGASRAIGWVMTNIILSIAFFLIVTPIGLVLRLSGRKLLDLEIDRSAASYWRRKGAGASDPSQCESQY
jgi:hypothetical protein